MSQASRTDPRSGFTLIEVMAVMTIIAMLASLAVAFIPGTGRADIKVLTLRTAALLRRERLGAILTGHSRRIALDVGERALVGDGGEVLPIPRDVVLDVVGVDERWSGRQAVVRFEPDGASTGAKLRFSREGADYEVNVNWYTGRVAIDPP
ncbi:general secretion pathway protein GspH [Bradyrhizobium macuxiense]|uniref:General secretion pathway protein GspH n=1 Tax=Bradyrhizobium macuxiense TaxID=1755647 RepID=A0A109JZB5_9BRAD|nr:prepilin-type N-terminal cleavage/methylation domain-containing protein [Bradyrhizobium macuxiense]KWV57813.1 general secretion pathway protein GspH [Bradyrhizobium macuxiense]